MHRALHAQAQLGSGIVSQVHRFLQHDRLLTFRNHIPCFRIEGRRRVPVSKFHFRIRLKKQRKLCPFGAKPKPILSAVGIHVFVLRAVESLVIDPAKAPARESISGGGENFPLKFGRNQNLGGLVGVAQ